MIMDENVSEESFYRAKGAFPLWDALAGLALLSGQIISGAKAPEPRTASKQLTTTTTQHEVLDTLVQPVGLPVPSGVCHRPHIQAGRQRARMLLLRNRAPRREDRILLCCTASTTANPDGEIADRHSYT